MTKTPIADFVKEYRRSGTVQMHMPGHKGQALTGAEPLDITEIRGADYLFEPEGIIRQSEALAEELYGSARTVFSTEGSSLSIKGMLGCVRAHLGSGARLAAARNCHRAFINGCILLGLEPVWIYPAEASESICSSGVTAEDVRRVLESDREIGAVYITSPDYPGNMADIKAIAEVCHSLGALLIVDNAHGAYLKFAGEGLHPLEQGADLCCDSAHKTLPALTGASLVHISKAAPAKLADTIAAEMSLFASTSPSYVIMQSIERSICELSEGLAERIRLFCGEVGELKRRLRSLGFKLIGDEPMKLTVAPASKGYTGDELAGYLRSCGIEPEYSDAVCVVLMPTPYNPQGDLERVFKALEGLPCRPPVAEAGKPRLIVPRRRLTLREAYFSKYERIGLDEAVGRICARTAMSCQPSVPVICGGEEIDKIIIKILKSYSFFEIDVVK